MKKNSFLPLLLISILATSMACSLFDSLVGKGAVVEDEVSEVVTETPQTDVVEDIAAPVEQESEDEAETSVVEQENETAEEGVTYDTIFPLPDDVQNFTGSGGDSQINFQTNLNVEEAIEFYRQAFEAENLYERSINTAITETTFSMVFDGHPNGKAIVIQGVDLGDGTTNINIRFEDL